jgi:hypothetical protein
MLKLGAKRKRPSTITLLAPEPEFLLELLVVAVDAPAQLG